MSLFCGSNSSGFSLKEDLFSNECLADLFIILHNVFLIISATITLIYLAKKFPSEVKSWNHFDGHHFRWIFTIFLFLFHLMQIGEGILSELQIKGLHFHLHIPHIFALCGTVLSIVYYNRIELLNAPKFLLLLLIHWIIGIAVQGIKVSVLFNKGLGVPHLRFDLHWDVIVVYVLLLIVELYVFFRQKYVLFRTARILLPIEELLCTKYHQSYVNFLSKSTFWWLSKVLIQGYKVPLEMKDLGKLPVSEQASCNHGRLSSAFDQEMEKSKNENKTPSLLISICKAFWPMVSIAAICKLVGNLLGFVGPLCIKGIVLYVSPPADNITSTTSPSFDPQYIGLSDFLANGFVLVFIMFIASMLQATFLQTHHHLVIREGIRCRAAIQTMVYNKALKISSFSLSGGDMTVGEIVNHMSIDAQQILMLFYFVNHIWGLPVQIILTLGLLYNILGVSALIGGSVIILLSPVQYKLAAVLAGIQKKTLGHSDSRLKLINELVQGIKLLKLYAWEVMFCEKVEQARKCELRSLFKGACVRSLSLFITGSAPVACTLITFVCYPLLENKALTADKAFSSLALFNILNVPLFLFPIIVNAVVNGKVSAHRILQYLLAPESSMDENLTKKKEDIDDVPVDEVSEELKRIRYGSEADKSLSSNSPPKSKTVLHENKQYAEVPLAELETELTDSPRSLESTDNVFNCEVAVKVEKGNYSWDPKSKVAYLKDIDLSVSSGQLTMIIGPVGSGKSSLLSALLGEMSLLSGTVTWAKNNSVAYAAQKAWLLNATMKDNILFGETYEKKRYEQVISSCALKADIEILPAGDLTEIGEKGINLSGGQKQRVSVARALYSSANIVILDDPLSALDVHVGRHLFEEGIMNFVLEEKRTVILVSHQLQYLKFSHQILVMKDGKMSCKGTLMTCKECDPEMYKVWNETIRQKREESKTEPDKTAEERRQLMRQCSQHPPSMSRSRLKSQMSECISEPGKLQSQLSTVSQGWKFDEDDDTLPLSVTKLNLFDDELSKDDNIAGSSEKLSEGKLIKAEERNKGTIALGIYWSYVKACTVVLALFSILIHLIKQGLTVGTDFWLAAWSTSNTQGLDEEKLIYYMRGYGILSAVSIVVMLVTALSTYYIGIRASRNLHRGMIRNIILAPMRFFDTTPVGRILNRFSSDISTVDIMMPSTLDNLMNVLFLCLTAIIVNAVTSPYFIIAVVPIIIMYYFLQWFYRASSREMQRLDSISKSPIFAHFSETLGGLSTIRAYKVQQRFREHILQCIDTNNTAFLFLNTANRWLGIRLDLLGSFIVFVAALASVFAGVAGTTSPGWVGLAIVYALNVALYLNWVVRHTSDAEMQMNGVERIQYYSNIPTEIYEPVTDVVAPEDWPQTGSIEFNDVSLTYDMDLDPVIRNVSLQISDGEKIGICGRTGSGKSSLTLGLFRLIDIAGGSISIDGINVKEVPLLLLRSKLAIIPQDPVLFVGSVRYNLDPEGTKSESDLWQALEIAQLKSTIVELPKQLDGEISEGGENFSVGQRQLFCLARAFLREAKILVMDEATASIDTETDRHIQGVLAKQFKRCTVFTIAHRISTILTSDRIIVLDNGSIVELGNPKELLKKSNGVFASLVKEDHK